MTRIADVISYLEQVAPLSYQESYDNSGIQVGDRNTEVSNILISLDTTEAIIDEAISSNCNMVISHHPVIFGGLKRIAGDNEVQRTIEKAIKNDICIYAIHTNLDNIRNGVNSKIAERLGLHDCKILSPKTDNLFKLVTFIPKENKEQVMSALFDAGVGAIGDYEHCSFTIEGEGSFLPTKNADPHIGETGKEETVNEYRVEAILPVHLKMPVLKALQTAHPYEEAAYYLTPLANTNDRVGSGMIGSLENEMTEEEFLQHLKDSMQTGVIRHTSIGKKRIKRVAVCGGAGSFLISSALRQKADAFVTGDVKYHDFFNGENQMIIADIGHYESEVFTKNLLQDLLTKKFSNFAVNLSKTVTNPVKYY